MKIIGRILFWTFVILGLCGVVWFIFWPSFKKTANHSPAVTQPAPVNPKPPISIIEGRLVLPQATKTEGCVAKGALPDPECTPGAIDAERTQASVCGESTKKYRSVSEQVKRQVYAMYGVAHHVSGEYEVDHFIPLELGGSNDIANLWPEPAEPRPGFHEKDGVENYLHSQVCKGEIDLAVAQQEIAVNWFDVYSKPH